MFDQLLEIPEVEGVIRYAIHPSFEPPKHYTFVFAGNAVVASLIRDGRGLWELLPVDAGTEPRVESLDRIVPLLSLGTGSCQGLIGPSQTGLACCPAVINRWEKVRELALQSPPCGQHVPDGVEYHHQL